MLQFMESQRAGHDRATELNYLWLGFPGSSASKESTCGASDLDSIPGSGRSPGEGKDYPLQYSCLKNPTARGVWRATVNTVTKESDTAE